MWNERQTAAMFRVMVVTALLTTLSGCSSSSGTATVLVSEGCVILIEGISTTQADEITKDWDINEGCELKATTNIGTDEE